MSRMNRLAEGGTKNYGVDLVIEGGAAIEKALDSISSVSKQKQIQAKALKTALRPVRKKARSKVAGELDTMNARARALLAKQLYITPVKRYRRTGTQMAKVAAKNKKLASPGGGTVNFAPLLHLFELGVSPHVIKQKRRTIHHPGIPARPLLAESLKATTPDATKLFDDTMWKWIKREWERG